jgi:hypothetical protein
VISMKEARRLIAAAAAASVASVALVSSPAAAAPLAGARSGCVAQQVQLEHEVFGAAWGHDVVAHFASDREGLGELGLRNFGEFAALFATADRENCPVEE